MTTDLKVVVGAIAASIILIVGATFVLGKDTRPKRESQGAAVMRIDKKSEDFGNMAVSEDKTATFTIQNTSPDSILRLWNVYTSCDCTFASVVIGGEKTGEFNMPMHMNAELKNWIGEVEPNGTATLLVTYKPSVMPVQGPVTRQVSFSSNDPSNAEVTVSVSANVQ